MKKIFLILLLFVSFVVPASAQSALQAKKLLDRTAALVGNKGGASASFTVSSAKLGKNSGTIRIKGNKFQATTNSAIVWYNGKTQWSMLKSTNEVNVSTPNATQQAAMNPYTFINLYKKGYRLSMTSKGNVATVTMKKTGGNSSISQAIVQINKRTAYPIQVKLLQNGSWITISISNFKKQQLSDAVFVFQQKDYPQAEVIDLR